MAMLQDHRARLLENPRWLTFLFSSTEAAWIWLIIRLYLGVQWVNAGWHKLFDDAWMSGSSLEAFWTRIVAVPADGRPAIAYDWYREFIAFMLSHGWYIWFGKLVAFGETAVGIALLIGLFTGVAALFGALMNWNFMLAGTASTNPVLGIMGIAVLAAWKIAGWWGADRFIMPLVGAPWQRGPLLGGEKSMRPDEHAEARRAAVFEWVRIAAGGAVLASALAYMGGMTQVSVALAGVAILGAGALFKLYRSAPRQGRIAPKTQGHPNRA